MQIKRVQSQLIIESDTSDPYCIYDEQHNCLYEGSEPYHYEGKQVHPVFIIKQHGHQIYLSERAVPHTKITNFRDLGGYIGFDHRQVKYGMFYRCAPMITKDDVSYQAVSELNIKTILDLRSQEEAITAQDQIWPNCHYVQRSAIQEEVSHNGNFDFKELMQKQPIETLQKYMKQMYEKLPFANPAYQFMFQCMLQQDCPIAIHCSAGKDRTGVGAYLILKTLGVDDETIMEDYLLSNVYRKEENEAICAKAGSDQRDLVMSLMEVQPSYLQSAINAIFKQYDTFEDFLAQEYGISETDITTLRNTYLYTK